MPEAEKRHELFYHCTGYFLHFSFLLKLRKVSLSGSQDPDETRMMQDFFKNLALISKL